MALQMPADWPMLRDALHGRRVVITTDGRLGVPDIVQYRLWRGGAAGQLLSVPPTVRTHPDPDSDRRPPITSPMAAKAWADWRPVARASLPYVTIVHDRDAYLLLSAMGFLWSPLHRGCSPL